MAQLLTAAAQGNEEFTGISAKDTAAALEQLMVAVREVAASMDANDKEVWGRERERERDREREREIERERQRETERDREREGSFILARILRGNAAENWRF